MPKLSMGTGSGVLMCDGGPPLCRGRRGSANDSLELKLRPVGNSMGNPAATDRRRLKSLSHSFTLDFVIGCEWAEDARRIKEVLPKRFAKYGLEINTEKTKLVDFGRPQRSTSGRKPGTCSFLGFVHYWGKTWRGSYPIKRKTEGKRLRRTLGEFWRWCRDNRHRPLQEQYASLCAKLRGYYQYYGIRCNSQCLDLVYHTATRAWRYWLNRRGGRKMTWRAFGRMMAAYPLLQPRIVKGWV